MPYTKEQTDRIEELYQLVESNKPHEYAAPTYKDVPCLREMEEIALSNNDGDADALEDRMGALWYLAECYYKMCRAALAAKYYGALVECHVKLVKIKKYDKNFKRMFDDSFYNACKMRNYYEPDDCEDLIELVRGSLPDGKIQDLYESAVESRNGLPKNEPVEKTEEYIAVIDEVEKLIDEYKTMDFCLEYWSLKSMYLAERGIHWRSPATLNPHVMFD